jgi:hypothetical protein
MIHYLNADMGNDTAKRAEDAKFVEAQDGKLQSVPGDAAQRRA